MELGIGINYNPTLNDKEIIKHWKDSDLYNKWIKHDETSPNFNFVDGPPFVSSSNLHFGHILVSLMKSTVLYFEKMNNKNVVNKLGYDTHGLPIEMSVNKILNLNTRQDVLQFGIDKYNAKCKETINSFSGAWKPIFEMVGRITNDNHYKTMDPTFMESVWYIFKEIYKKGYVYEGKRVMPFSIGCNTPISNFEASQNYKEIDTLSIYVAFLIHSQISYLDYTIFPNGTEQDIYIVTWTTTPWTLPCNMALCINIDELYVLILAKKDNKYFIIAKNSVQKLFSDYTYDNSNYNILEVFIGLHLVGSIYEPLYRYEATHNHTFRIVEDNYVQCFAYDKDKSPGSGVVHLAPGFGEDDFRVCKKSGIIINDSDILTPIDENGKFTLSSAPHLINSIELNGMFYKDANKLIIKDLENRGILIKSELYRHSYPFCWRTDTPLIYKAVHSWFINTIQLKDQMIANNKKINWYPSHIGSGRFNKWLEDTKDWCISRNRFFGTPIPIWVNKNDNNDIIVIGSIQELVEFSGLTREQIWGDKPIDLHSEFIDHITIVKDNKTYKRINEVFDCWFESGCVPYAQNHYPFSGFRFDETSDALCDFICEGIDQTRGWFYTLHVIATALFNKPAFKNVICSGLILAGDGKKMSKNLGNYTDPIDTLKTFGSDNLRLYMLNLPATYAESSRFVEDDIKIQTKCIQQWINSFRFIIENIRKYENVSKKSYVLIVNFQSSNEFDQWILSCLMSAISDIKSYMIKYEFTKCISTIYNFIENYTNWYLKFNRNRLKGKEGCAEWINSLNTSIYITNQFNLAVAPFMPFLSETIFINLKKWNISYCDNTSALLNKYPEINNVFVNIVSEDIFAKFQKVCEAIRILRNKVGLSSVKIPIKTVKVITESALITNNLLKMKDYFYREEINVLDILFENPSSDQCNNITITINLSMGKIYRNNIMAIKQYLSELSISEKIEIMNNPISKICGYDIPREHLIIKEIPNTKMGEHETLISIDNMKVILDKSQDKSVFENHFIRMVIYHTQKIRKSLGIRPWDIIQFYYNVQNKELSEILTHRIETLNKELYYNITFSECGLDKWGEDTFKYEYNGQIEDIKLVIYKL